MNIGKNIRILREQSLMSQSELARKINVSPATVSSWESGRTEPDLTTMQKICAALDHQMIDLLYADEPLVDKSLFVIEEKAVELTDDEELMLDTYRKLSTKDRLIIYSNMVEMLSNK